MASSLISAGRSLAKSPSHSSVYIRPSRTATERLELRERSKRLAQLRQEFPQTSFFINYRTPSFKIVRLVDGKPDWTWSDPGPAAPTAPNADASSHSSPVLSQPAAQPSSQAPGFRQA